MAVQTQIQIRRGAAATWTSTNPTLAAGEIGLETDTAKFKIGSGSTAWASLAYYPTLGANTFTGAQTATSLIVTGSTAPTNGMYLPAANTLGFSTNSTVQLRIDSSGNVGITTAPVTFVRLNLGGSGLTASGNESRGISLGVTFPQTATTVMRNYYSAPTTEAAVYTAASLRHFNSANATIGAGSTLTNQYGFFSDALSGATNNYAFYGNSAAATNNWNFYAAGTAANYFAGQTTVGSTSLTLGASSVAQQFGVVSTSATNIGAVIRGASAQTGDLLQVQNSSGTNLAKIDSAGFGTFGNLVVTSSTVPTNGMYLPTTNSIGLTTNSTERMRIDSTGKIGIGQAASVNDIVTVGSSLTGNVASQGVNLVSTIASDVTTAARGFNTFLSTAASAFTLGSLAHYRANQNTIGAGSTVTNQIGFNAESSLTGATNNFGFYGAIASGTNRWNTYMVGTADNYFAGNVGIGTTTPAAKLDVNGSANFTNYFAAGKNKILNGDFAISQRGTSFTYAASGRTLDRWDYGVASAVPSGTITQETFTPGAAPVAGYEGRNFFRSNVTATNGCTLLQHSTAIEDVRTLAGQTATLSFWIRASAATVLGSITFQQYFGVGGSSTVSLSGTPSDTAVTSSFVRKSVTVSFPSISGKTIGTGSALSIAWNFPIVVSTFDIWGLQLEAGSVATPFTTASGNSPQAELALCQRYYYRTTADTTFAYLGFGMCVSTTVAKIQITPPVTMRIVPTTLDTPTVSTLRLTDGVTGTTATAVAYDTDTTNEIMTFNVSVASGLTQFRPIFFGANNSAVAYIGFGAEL